MPCLGWVVQSNDGFDCSQVSHVSWRLFSITEERSCIVWHIVSESNDTAVYSYQVKADGLWPGADPNKAWSSAKVNTQIKVKKVRHAAVFN